MINLVPFLDSILGDELLQNGLETAVKVVPVPCQNMRFQISTKNSLKHVIHLHGNDVHHMTSCQHLIRQFLQQGLKPHPLTLIQLTVCVSVVILVTLVRVGGFKRGVVTCFQKEGVPLRAWRMASWRPCQSDWRSWSEGGRREEGGEVETIFITARRQLPSLREYCTCEGGRV